MDGYLSDFFNKAIQGSGFGTGAEAASTVGGVLRSAASTPSAPVTTAAESSSPISYNPEQKIFGMSQHQALIVAGALVVGFIVLRRIKK